MRALGAVDVNKPDRDGATALHHAAYRGHIKVVKLLAEKGNYIHPKLPTDHAHVGATIDALDGDGITPLLHAAFTGKLDVVKFLLSKGGNVNHRDGEGGMALQNAAFNGHVGVVRILIEAGADVEITDQGILYFIVPSIIMEISAFLTISPKR